MTADEKQSYRDQRHDDAKSANAPASGLSANDESTLIESLRIRQGTDSNNL
jgi:hypothetical protein